MAAQTRAAGKAAEVVAGVIAERRTVQVFEPAPVPPREVVLRALELAQWAPNHRLTYPWRFYLLGRRTAAAVARLNAELVTAKLGEAAGRNKLERWLDLPGWLVVTCARSADALRAEEDYAACACAVQNAQLYLWSEGVGTKWATGEVTRDARFFELIGADPSAERVVALLWYGYPAAVPAPPPRRPLAERLVERP